jgi:hypothetical protein
MSAPAAAVGLVWPSEDAFATGDEEQTRVYDDADVEHLLGGLVAQVVLAWEEQRLDADDALRVYLRVREELLVRPRAFQTMSQAQRTSLCLVFVTCIRARVQRRRWTRTEFLAEGLRSLNMFPYAVHLRDTARMVLGENTRVMDQWTLKEWMDISAELVKALERCGAALEGAEEMWEAHWDRFASLLDSADVEHPPLLPGASDDEADSSDDDNEARTRLSPQQEAALLATGVLHPNATPEQRVEIARTLAHIEEQNAEKAIEGLYNDERYNSRHAEGDPLLIHPMPFVYKGRRLNYTFFSTLELRFHAYHARFQTLRAFQQAAVRDRALEAALRKPLRDAEPHKRMVAFLEWLNKHQDTITRHMLREKVGTPMSTAHLQTGEATRAFVRRFERALERGNPREVLDEAPSPTEVLAEMRREAHQQVERYLLTSGDHVKRVIEGHLRSEAAAEREWKPIPLSHDTERLALLLLPALLDASLSRLKCKHRFTDCSWLDALRQKHVCPRPLFATPEEAVARFPEAIAAGALVVCILRRYFVVSCLHDAPVVVEVPTLSSAMLLWLAFACAIEEKQIPLAFRDSVKQLR